MLALLQTKGNWFPYVTMQRPLPIINHLALFGPTICITIKLSSYKIDRMACATKWINQCKCHMEQITYQVFCGNIVEQHVGTLDVGLVERCPVPLMLRWVGRHAVPGGVFGKAIRDGHPLGDQNGVGLYQLVLFSHGHDGGIGRCGWRKYALEAIIKLLFISSYHDKCLLFMLELY